MSRTPWPDAPPSPEQRHGVGEVAGGLARIPRDHEDVMRAHAVNGRQDLVEVGRVADHAGGEVRHDPDSPGAQGEPARSSVASMPRRGRGGDRDRDLRRDLTLRPGPRILGGQHLVTGRPEEGFECCPGRTLSEGRATSASDHQRHPRRGSSHNTPRSRGTQHGVRPGPGQDGHGPRRRSRMTLRSAGCARPPGIEPVERHVAASSRCRPMRAAAEASRHRRGRPWCRRSPAGRFPRRRARPCRAWHGQSTSELVVTSQKP